MFAPRLENTYEYVSVIFSVVMSKYRPRCRRVPIQGILLIMLKQMNEGEIFVPAMNVRKDRVYKMEGRRE